MRNLERADGHTHDIDKCSFEIVTALMKLVERTTSVVIKRDEVSDDHVISVQTTNPWSYSQRNALLPALNDCNISLDKTTHA